MEQLADLPKVTTMKRMGLREIWVDEAKQFTPWLAENIQLLNEATGLQLEVQAQEKSVGIFRADIVANDIMTGETVLIENQIEETDHCHLGQIFTYTSGLQAGTAIWIAARFNDEHRAALDWLNQITVTGVRFFGLEIELWSVEGSMPAAKLNVVCRPNDWKKRIMLQRRVTSANRGEVVSSIHKLLEEDQTISSYRLADLTGCSEATARRIKNEFMVSFVPEQ